MADADVGDSVVTVDRWSKILALFVAAGVFLGASALTDDGQFNMIVAAFAGIGARLYIPYHVRISTAGPAIEPLSSYEGTGNYHHGAVGGAVLLGAVVALGVMVVEPNSTPAIGAGGVAGLVAFGIFNRVFPS